MTAVEEGAEWWIQNTQATLGQFVLKPKLTGERLRKPPFRFLFDVVAEVARQTGFGVHELFGGEPPPAKPVAPNSREDKTLFIDSWIATVRAALGEHAVAIQAARGSQVVCGLEPELTNMLLHATAAACFPEQVPPPAPIPTAEEIPAYEEQAPEEIVAPEEALPVQPELAAVEDLVGAVEAPPPESIGVVGTGLVEDEVGFVEAPPAEEQVPLVVPETQQVLVPDAQQPQPLEEAVQSLPLDMPQEPALAEEAVAPFSGAMLAPDGIDAEQAKEIASQMDFNTALAEFENLNAEFQRTCDFQALGAMQAPAPDQAEEDDVEPADAVPFHAPEASERPMTGAERKPAVVQRIDEGLSKANRLLEDIDALICDEEESKAATEAKRLQKAQDEARMQQEQEEWARSEEERAAEEQRLAAEEEERLWEAQQRMLEEEEDIPEAPEKPKKEKKPKKVYPKSKASLAQGARIVSCVGGEDENQAMYDSGDEEEDNVPVKPGMAGMSQTAPAGGFGLSAHPLGGISMGGGLESIDEKDGGLLNRMKLQCGDTFISFLLNSLPQSLLKQAEPDELIECLQLLLEEFRKCIATQGLEDAFEEEPTTLAAELRELFPNDWLPHLQSHSPAILRQKYELIELLDTLQALAQICYERLCDEKGPMTSWAPEDSPLRTQPKAPPPRAPSPEKHCWERNSPELSTSPVEGPWDGTLGKASWEDDDPEPTPTMAQAQPSAPVQYVSAAAFDGSLGPALWDMEPEQIHRPMTLASATPKPFAQTMGGGFGHRPAPKTSNTSNIGQAAKYTGNTGTVPQTQYMGTSHGQGFLGQYPGPAGGHSAAPRTAAGSMFR